MGKLVPFKLPPGVNLKDAPYASKGRWNGGNFYRFIAGFPEKLGGWAAIVQGSGSAAMYGATRGMLAWRDNNQNIRVGLGTSLKLYHFYNNILTDITPFRLIRTGSLTNPVSTTNASKTVTVAHTAHGLSTNDVVVLTAASAVGGITLAGNYLITVVDANTYTVPSAVAANATAGPGGGTVTYSYTRKGLSSPFSTTSGSAVVTVTDAGHGASNNDFTTFAGSTAVAGLTIAGEYQISNVTANTYTITALGNANATAIGGGSPTVQYDLSGGFQDSTAGQGWGVGTYGGGTYGTFQTASYILQCRTWSLAAYGQQLLANPYGGTIYYWDPTMGGRALPLYNAPTTCLGILVTQERFLIALGPNGSVMQIAWPDQNDDTAWTVTATNTANAGRNLQGGSILVGGVTLRAGVSVLWSNNTAFQHLYTGDDFIFDTRGITNGAGLIGPLAAVAFDNNAYWMSDADFWRSDGAYAEPLESDDVRDFVFKNINTVQAAKCVAGVSRAKREIWFFYPSAASAEIDSYVIYSVDQKCWSQGSLQRTSWIDRDLVGNPMAVDLAGNIYNHETGVDNNGAAMDSILTSAPTDIEDGDENMDILGIIPDFQRQTGNVALSLLTSNYPGDAQTAEGPYTSAVGAGRLDTRAAGKLAAFKLESNALGGDWRLGTPRLDVQPQGARR